MSVYVVLLNLMLETARDVLCGKGRAHHPIFNIYCLMLLARNDKEAVRQLLMAAVAVPGALWATSCLFLVFIGERKDFFGHRNDIVVKSRWRKAESHLLTRING